MKSPEDEAFEEIERIQRTRTRWATVQQQAEPPKYSFKVHWEKDRRIGVVAAVVRPDGGIHLLQETIDPPQREWVGLDEVEIAGMTCECVDDGTFNMDCAHDFARAIEAKLKEKNT
jgi:hypothetical protein